MDEVHLHRGLVAVDGVLAWPMEVELEQLVFVSVQDHRAWSVVLRAVLLEVAAITVIGMIGGATIAALFRAGSNRSCTASAATTPGRSRVSRCSCAS